MKPTSGWALLSLMCAAAVLCGSVAPSAPPSPAPQVSPSSSPGASAEDVRTVLADRVRDAPGVGIIIGVIEGGRTRIYTAGSSGTSLPLDEHTLFQIGSVTKTFTATILAGMVLDGSVELDAPVASYLPKNVHVPSRNGKQITLLNLATQHSGLPRLPTNLDNNSANPYANYTLADMYAFLSSYKLTRDPGDEFEYSNLGISVLGNALAARAHLTYSQLLERRILSPLGMHETVTSLTPQLRSRLAPGHDADGDPATLWTFQAVAPAGAIISSLADMLKYLRANMAHGPLAKACLFAQAPRATLPGGQIGLVWWTGQITHIIHHGGDTNAYHAWVAVSPDRSKGSVVLTNGGSSVEDIALHAIEPTFPIVPEPAVAQLDSATLDSYMGTYKNTENLAVTITRSGDKLLAQLTGQPSARIYPSARDHFYYKVVQAKIDFTRDASGAVNALILRQEGQNLVFVHPGMTPPPPSAADPSYPPAVSLDSATLNGYVGRYHSASGLEFLVTRVNDNLFVQLQGQLAAPVYPSAQDHFYYKIVDAQIDFERDGTGHVKDLVLHQNGLNLTAIRQ